MTGYHRYLKVNGFILKLGSSVRGGKSMKIQNVPGIVGAYNLQGSRKAVAEPGVARPSKADGVVLSKEAQEVRSMKEKLNGVPRVRQERVEELQRQIEAGTYRPDGREVAGKMLQSRVFDELL
jgi:negative regulator of flagellin synthesis FlgM